jgi:hypothetical protein
MTLEQLAEANASMIRDARAHGALAKYPQFTDHGQSSSLWLVQVRPDSEQ